MLVTYVDGREVTVRIGPKSQVHYERQFNKTMFDYARGRRSIEEVYWLAWHALREVNEETREFDDFLAVIEDVEPRKDTPETPVDDQAVNPEPDPSRKVQPPETS
jgi:hypothetical protein